MVVLETDKVSVDVRATEAGVITEIMGDLDDVVEVGQDLYKIDTDAAAPEGGGGGGEEKKEEESVAASAPAAAAPPPAAGE